MVLNTPVGRIMLEENGRAMTRLSFCSAEVSGSFFEKTPLLLQASEQIIGYFSGNLKNFQLPLEPEGTSFQKQVWALLQQIPYGETRSYRQIAEQSGPRGQSAHVQRGLRQAILFFWGETDAVRLLKSWFGSFLNEKREAGFWFPAQKDGNRQF